MHLPPRPTRATRSARTARGVAALVVVTLALTTAAVGPSGAATRKKATIEVTAAWARTSPMDAANGAVYMTIANAGTKDNALVGASVPMTVAMEAQIHQTTMGPGGTMAMSEVSSITIPKKASQVLEPGGYHIMLMGLKTALVVGDTVSVTLDFERGADVTVKAAVKQ